jgi:hypothetical protein
MPASLLLLAALAGSPSGSAAAASPERELALRYAPIVRLQLQPAPCGHGEPYQPTDVDAVLGSEEVALRGPWDPLDLVAIAPSAGDLGAGRIGYHLDFPGDPLEPGCDYERWSKRMAARSTPTVYARVAPGGPAPGLALQYWLFYAYNDFNNKHEGDWEWIQLVFDAADAAEALREEPLRVGLSQHESAEQAAWGDPKLERVGARPVVYPAAGSHANYFEPALYLGRSAAQGVGCDDTTGPSRTLEPRVAWVPSAPDEALAAFPWLAFPGHWGEHRRPAFYDGPTGPSTKPQWNAPIAWADESWRERSYAVPGGSLLGPGATGFFCDAVEGGSDLLRQATIRPGPVALVLAATLGGLAWLATRTSWRPGAPLRLGRRREVGQMLSAAARLYAMRPALFVGIGLVFVPLALLASLLEQAVLRLAGLAARAASAGEANTLGAALSLGLAWVSGLVALGMVQAACSRAMRDLDERRPASVRAAYAGVARSLPRLLRAVLGVALPTAALAGSAIGLPLGLAWLVRTSLVAQAVELEGHAARPALRRSAALTRGRVGRSAALLVAAAAVPLLAGPFVGVALLLQGGLPLHAVNLAASLVYAVVVPYAAIATTYLYFDLRVRERLEPRPDARARVRELPAEL